MTAARTSCSLAAIPFGFLFLFVAIWWGAPLQNVGWAGPALGIAIAALVFRGGISNDRIRDALTLFASAALLAASAVGLRALWSVTVYLWSVARGPADGAPLFVILSRFQFGAGMAWVDHWPAISSWGAVAFLPLLFALALGVPSGQRLFAGSREIEGGPWRARWMTQAEASYLKRQQAGLPLGRINGRLLRYRDNARLGWRGGHHMVIAGTRGGKGVSCVLPAILEHSGPVIAIDVKGELFAVTRRWRRSLGQHVVVLNPLSVVEAAGSQFNPLDYVRDHPDHITRDAELIADGLVKPEGDSGEHFYVMARNLVSAAIEVVVRIADPDERNLNTVAAMLGSDMLATLEGWRDNEQIVGTPAARVAAAILNAGDKERGSILTTVSKALAWTSSPPMQRFLARSDFDLAEIVDGTADIFLVVPLDQIATLSVFLRLMVNIVAGVAIRQMGIGNLAKPILLVLDEFTRLGRMQKLVDIATVAAGAGVEALFVTQDRAQISAVYRDGEADTLLGSCCTVRVFNLGRTDIKTAEWVAAGIGDRTVRAHSQQITGKKRESGAEQRAKLITADQILELPPTELIALFSGRPPLRLDRIISQKDPEYRDKLDPNPTIRT